MKFLENNTLEMITVDALYTALKEVVGIYIDCFWKSYDDVDDPDFDEYEKEVLELDNYNLDLSWSSFTCRKGVNTYEYIVDFLGTDWGDYSTVVKWDFTGRLESIEVKLDGKEVKEFDHSVGYAIYKVVSAALFNEEWRYVADSKH